MNSGIRRVRRLLSLEKPSAGQVRPTQDDANSPTEAPATERSAD